MNAANAFVADEPVPKPPMTPSPASAMEAAKEFLLTRDIRLPLSETFATALTAAERRGYDAARNLLDSVRTYPDAVRLLDANRPKDC